MNKNDYYVYEHIRLDNNTCFYVGKGRGKRANFISRNEHHNRIVEKCGMKVKIIKDNLSEEEAYQFERELIQYYVFTLGYGIDIIGYNNKKVELGHLTNHTFGGDGSFGMVHSEEWCKQHSVDMLGKNNPMYGINVWISYFDEKVKEIKEKLSLSSSGKNNSMYGISPKERMTNETYKNWLEKTHNRLSNQYGENNPNYGNKTLHNKVKDNPELRIQYYSRPGSQNGRAKEVYVYDLDGNYIKDFGCIKDCAEWMQNEYKIKCKIDSMRPYIIKSVETGKPYKNLIFSYIKK